MKTLHGFWLNFLATLFLGGLSAVDFLFALDFKNEFKPKDWPQFSFSVGVASLVLIFGLFRLAALIRLLIEKRWLAAALTAAQIAVLSALFYGDLFLMALPFMGNATDMPGDGI